MADPAAIATELPPKGYGCIPSPPDPRDHPPAGLEALGAGYAELPLAISPLPAVWDQVGETCVGQAVAGAVQTALWPILHRWPFDERSALELYALCKQRDGLPDTPGTYIRVALAIAKDTGILGVDGIRYKITGYQNLMLAADRRAAVRAALALGRPIVRGMTWWWTTASGGLMLEPVGDLTRPAPGHAIYQWRNLIDGNMTHPAPFPGSEVDTDRNSWGAEFGSNGNGNVMSSTQELYTFEAWTFTVR